MAHVRYVPTAYSIPQRLFLLQAPILSKNRKKWRNCEIFHSTHGNSALVANNNENTDDPSNTWQWLCEKPTIKNGKNHSVIILLSIILYHTFVVLLSSTTTPNQHNKIVLADNRLLSVLFFYLKVAMRPVKPMNLLPPINIHANRPIRNDWSIFFR